MRGSHPIKTISDLSEANREGNLSSSNGSSGISRGNDLPALQNHHIEPRHTPEGDKNSSNTNSARDARSNASRLSGDMVFAAPSGPTGVPIFSKDIEVISVKAVKGPGDSGGPEEEVPNTWMNPTQGDHDGLYVKFLRRFLFPFFVRFSPFIVAAWVVIFAISCAFGLRFLDNTRSNLDLPGEER
jgi:hypothetical protein